MRTLSVWVYMNEKVRLSGKVRWPAEMSIGDERSVRRDFSLPMAKTMFRGSPSPRIVRRVKRTWATRVLKPSMRLIVCSVYGVKSRQRISSERRSVYVCVA